MAVSSTNSIRYQSKDSLSRGYYKERRQIMFDLYTIDSRKLRVSSLTDAYVQNAIVTEVANPDAPDFVTRYGQFARFRDLASRGLLERTKTIMFDLCTMDYAQVHDT